MGLDMKKGMKNGPASTTGYLEVEWPDTIKEARRLQFEMAARVRCRPLGAEPGLVAGVDAAFSKTKVFAAACLFACPRLEPVEDAFVLRDLVFPYIPGYLTFREGPAMVEAIAGLGRKPDLVLVDGQGIAHPRGLGIASHLGVLLGIPTVGCAKSRLIGDHREPGLRRGARTQLRYQGRIVGAVVRTRTGVKPMFVSPGHLVDVSGAVRMALRTTSRFRIPEPIRRADALSKAGIKKAGLSA